MAAGDCHEAMTHATRPDQAEQLRRFAAVAHPRPAVLHAAGSALLDTPAAYFDVVRPGLALYAGAVRVTAPLLEVREADRTGRVHRVLRAAVRRDPSGLSERPQARPVPSR